MKSRRPIHAYKDLREQPLWRLLTAERAPLIVGLLQTLLYDGNKVLSSSALHEELDRELASLRAHGDMDIPAAAQPAISDWVRKGWLVRRFPAGAPEEEYELSSEAAEVVRFLSSQAQPRSVATESRLANVINQLWRLAEETDPNPTTRLAALDAERERINRERDAISGGVVKTLEDDRALERARDIIALAEGLTVDFRRVRDEFAKLNLQLRKDLLEHDGSRSEVLEALFVGADLIAESPQGLTFAAFWDLLNDPQQSTMLTHALHEIKNRPFARGLISQELAFLNRLTSSLRSEGGDVNDVMYSLARSLKNFVKSREYVEHRRINALLKAAESAALAAKDKFRVNESVGYKLTLTSSKIRSVSQWRPYNPEEQIKFTSMQDAGVADITLEAVSYMIRQAEIDFRTLRANLRSVLEDRTQATIAQVLDEFPAEQGLGSVMGYISLGAVHGQVLEGERERVKWEGNDGATRSAWVPAIFFLQERLNELSI